MGKSGGDLRRVGWGVEGGGGGGGRAAARAGGARLTDGISRLVPPPSPSPPSRAETNVGERSRHAGVRGARPNPGGAGRTARRTTARGSATSTGCAALGGREATGRGLEASQVAEVTATSTRCAAIGVFSAAQRPEVPQPRRVVRHSGAARRPGAAWTPHKSLRSPQPRRVVRRSTCAPPHNGPRFRNLDGLCGARGPGCLGAVRGRHSRGPRPPLARSAAAPAAARNARADARPGSRRSRRAGR